MGDGLWVPPEAWHFYILELVVLYIYVCVCLCVFMSVGILLGSITTKIEFKYKAG